MSRRKGVQPGIPGRPELEPAAVGHARPRPPDQVLERLGGQGGRRMGNQAFEASSTEHGLFGDQADGQQHTADPRQDRSAPETAPDIASQLQPGKMHRPEESGQRQVELQHAPEDGHEHDAGEGQGREA